MTRRRLLLFSLPAVVAIVVAIAVAGWLLSPRTAITRENYAKIRKGMPRNDVEAILGAPDRIRGEPLIYRWYKVATGHPTEWAVGDWQQGGPDARYVHSASWYRLETGIEVDFDDNNCVCGSQYVFAFDPHK